MSQCNVDLVLINPGNAEQVYQSLAAEFAAIEPPVWAGLMATFVREKGYSVAIVDANAEKILPSEMAQRVAALNPKLAVVVVYGHQPSASTQNMPASSAACSALKTNSPDLPVMLIGGHASALPERTLREEDVDFVCTGEGLYTLVELLQAIKSNDTNYSKIRDLMFFQGDQVARTGAAPLLKALDEEMPGIAWDLLPMDKYRAHNWHCLDTLQREPYAAIYTTLGCPYHCSFCCIQAPFKSGEKELGYKETVNSYRFWSPESVMKQIDTLVNDYGVRNIKIADEMFVLNRRHVEGICDLIVERGYDLNIWAYARVDTVKEGMSAKLKKAGVNWLAFGFEAANERVRDHVQKGFDQDDIFRTRNAVRDEGIYVIGNYIFGLPEDDLETMQQTLDLALDLNCEFANFYCSTAYPGSVLYEQALKEKWPLPEKWSGYSQHAKDTLPLPTNYLSSGEVLRFRDKAFQTYFLSERYLSMIADTFGMDAVGHIKKMASRKLEREYA